MKNPVKLFNHLNQKEDWYRQWCPVYSAIINLKYNCWIELNKTDIDEIIKICKSKGFRSEQAWWYGKPCFTEVYNYAIKKYPWISYSIIDRNSPNFSYYFDKHYMLTIWIGVNSKWIEDKKDWKIDEKEYTNLAWNDLNHFTNIMRWEWWSEDWKNFFYDSYFWKEDNLYEFDFKEIKDVMKNWVYMFYLK